MNRQMIAETQKETHDSIRLHSGILQRSCSNCPKKRKLLQRRAVRQAEPEAVPPIVHEVLRTPGQPLDWKAREFMESRFSTSFSRATVNSVPQGSNLTIGQPNDSYEQEADRTADSIMQSKPSQEASAQLRYDFSHVRVHDDARAEESARAVNARAYTVGQTIVFGRGMYTTGTTAGQRLIAHELTHTIQQRGVPERIRRDSSNSMSHNPSDIDQKKTENEIIAAKSESREYKNSGSYETGSSRLQRQYSEGFRLLSDIEDYVNICIEHDYGESICSKEVIEHLCEKYNFPKCKELEFKCPPGFKSGSGNYKGLCCREGFTRNKTNCCPKRSITIYSMFPRCCPEGTKVDLEKKNCIARAPPIKQQCPRSYEVSLSNCICPRERVNPQAERCCPEGQEGTSGKCEIKREPPPPQQVERVEDPIQQRRSSMVV